MSWLGKLFGKGDPAHAGASAATTAPAAATPADPFDGFENVPRAERRPRLEAFLGDLARSRDDGHVVAHPNDQTVDAQGALGGFPVRIQAEESNASPELRLTLRLPQPVGNFALVVDPTINQTRERADAWSDNIRIFFARSVFVLGSARGRDLVTGRPGAELVREQALRFATLPEATRARVLALLVGNTGFDVRRDEIRMWMQRRVGAAEVKQTALAMLDAMVELARTMPAVAAIPAGAIAAGADAPQLVRCGYCQAEFFLDSHAACCHCGAPFRPA